MEERKRQREILRRSKHQHYDYYSTLTENLDSPFHGFQWIPYKEHE